MKNFSTKKAVKIIDAASNRLKELADDWDECDTVNGSGEIISESSDSMYIVAHVSGLLAVAAGMLEDCTQ